MKSESNARKELWDNPWIKYLILPVVATVIGGIILFIVLNPFSNEQDAANSGNDQKEAIISQQSKKVNISKLEDVSESGEITIRIISIANEKEVEAILDEMRTSAGLRKLTPLETGRKIEETPTHTFFFVFFSYLRFLPYKSDEDYFEEIKGSAIVDNRKSFIYYEDFELHYISENGLYLIGFISADAGSLISKLNGKEEKKIVVVSYPWNGLNTMVRLPMKRIVKADDRMITTDEGKNISVLDVYIK